MTYSIILDFWMDIHLWEDFWTSNITIQSGCRPAWLTRTSTDTFHCKLSSLSQILTCIFLHRCNWQPRTSISHGLVWSQNNEYVTQFANRRLTVSLSYQTKRPYVVSCVSQKKTRLCLARDCQHHSAPWMAATNSAFSPCPALSTDTEACNRATPDEPKGRNNSPTKNDMFHAEILWGTLHWKSEPFQTWWKIMIHVPFKHRTGNFPGSSPIIC